MKLRHGVPKHRAHGRWWTRWWVIASALVLVGGLTAGFVVANRGPSPSQVKAQKAKVAAVQAQAVLAAQDQLLSSVSVTPDAGAKAVELDQSVEVSTTTGFLKSVKVSETTDSLAGAMNATDTKWVSNGALEPNANYTVAFAVTGPTGLTASGSTTFATLTPIAQVTATVWPSEGLQVGVGQPIVLYFDQDISSTAAQQAVESHFTIAESKPVPGGWYWFSEDELHFRPEAFWPAGEQIQVTGDLNGWNAGSGAWGAGQISDSFSVGAARISYANLQTEEMTVTLDGATVAKYPISGGRPEYPTMDGTHIVLDRESVVHMVSSTVGIPVNSPNGYNEYVYDDVHISDSGEYVHAAPWSVYAQGSENVSHGCINISPTDAWAFYNFSRVGDVVEVTGSPRPPLVGDHGVMDWSTPWSQWKPGKVVALGGASPTTSTTLETTYSPPPYQAPTPPPTSAPAVTATTAPRTTTTTRPTTTTTKPRPTAPTTNATPPTTTKH